MAKSLTTRNVPNINFPNLATVNFRHLGNFAPHFPVLLDPIFRETLGQ